MRIQVERQEADDYSSVAGQFRGFTKLDELEWDHEPYQFEITGVWVRNSDGTVWYADDSGCSCPTPWESTTWLERLFSFDQIQGRYDENAKTDHRYGHTDLSEWLAFKENVTQALARLSER